MYRERRVVYVLHIIVYSAIFLDPDNCHSPEVH